MTKHTVYFVINKNPKTCCPDGWKQKEWKPYAGQYLQSSGYQVANLSEAKMYWTLKGANKLADRMNSFGVPGRNYHIGTGFTDPPEEVGVYEVVPATITVP